ncbi:N-acetylmuramoyl-L-alanine amidase [Pseudaeromonas sharmana]|uniref:N-acetylmuramoyl-L-alanine amidase n=1 Tax=Pseudaeromonas sharmana TaxID=328412 RepID=A0ABV8CIH4_9GAMM
MRFLLLLPLTLLLGLMGCQQTPYHLSRIYTSPNQDSRIRYLIVHYTQADDARALQLLTTAGSGVSAHYLLSTPGPDGKPTLYALLPESQRAWHAGRSSWHHQTAMNDRSLGIEVVNSGYQPADARGPLMTRYWPPFPQSQLHALASLLQQLSDRYHIPPQNLLGHSDIAPGRKVDPGPAFPWHYLYQRYRLGAWPEENRVRALLQQGLPELDITALQHDLARYGYAVPASGVLDDTTRQVVQAFQLHFRPSRFDGEPDAETRARLQALLEKYVD